MAKNTIKGITVAVGGDTTGLQKALNDVNKKSSQLSAELRQVENGLKLNPTNTTLLAQKQQILAEQVKNTSAKLTELKNVQAKVEERYKNGEIGADAYRTFQRELVNTENRLSSLQSEQKNLKNTTKETNEETEKAEKETKDYGKALESLASIAATANQAILDIAKAAGEMAVKGIKAATNVGMEFESSISQLAATMGTSVDNISDLTEKAKEMGATTQFSATQASQGLNILAMSGLKAEEQMVSIDKVLNLAAAGSLSLETAASYATGAVKGFGDEMDNMQYYTDLMAKGATLANTNVEGLGQALSASSATANSYKQKADSVTLSLLRLAEQNITGEAAATSLNRAMADLYTPTDVAKKALDELGISAYDSEGNTRDFNVVVDELNKKLKDMTAEESNAYKAAIFTTNGLNAFNKMTASSTEKVEKFKEELANANGSAEEQAKTMIDNLQGDITLFQSATEGLGNAFYETFNQDFRENVQFATDSISDLTAAFQNGGLEEAANVAGSIIADIANKAAEYAPTIIDTVSTVIGSTATAMAENSPMIASAASDLIKSLADGLVNNAWTVMNAFENILQFTLKELPNVISTLIGSAGDYVSKVINFLVDISAIVLNALPDIIIEIINKFSDTISIRLPQIISGLTRLMSVVAKSLPNIIKPVIDELPKLLNTVLNSIKDNVPALLNGVIEMAETLLTQLTPILSTALPELISIITELIPETISAIVDAVFENLPILLDGVSMLVIGIVNALPSMIENIIAIIPTLIIDIFNAFSNSLPSIIGIVGALILNIAEVLPDLIVSIIDVLPDLINSIIVSVTTFLPIFIETGIALFTAIINDLPAIINGIVEKLPEIIDSIISALLDALPLLIDCGVDLFLALIENLPIIIMEIAECIPQIIEGVVKAVIELFPRIVTVGMQLFMSLVEKLPDVIKKLANRMPEIVTGLTDKLKEHIHNMVDIGKNLVEGIWEGIKNAKDWLIDNIFGWCDTVTDSIKNFFGIHSPSTLFEDEIGNNLALGIGEGFADTMSDVSKNMQDNIPTSFDINPNLNLTSGDSRMQTFSNIPTLSGANIQPVQSNPVINLTLQIDNFNNNYGTAVEDMTETMMNKIFDYVRRNKLAVGQ